MTFRDYAQGAFRMRGIGAGQRIGQEGDLPPPPGGMALMAAPPAVLRDRRDDSPPIELDVATAFGDVESIHRRV